MNLSAALARYQGVKLTRNEISQYQHWARSYFHNEAYVVNPYLSMTLTLELDRDRRVYEASFQHEPGASFQGYLVWNLVKALRQEWTFSTRVIEGNWYLFNNLPVHMPLAVGGDLRFKDVILENVISMDWKTFSQCYRQAIDTPTNEIGTLDQLVWAISIFIGNLPNLNFTSFQIHRGTVKTGRPLFYFGQRQQDDSRYSAPLSISFDHANADPYVLDRLLRNYHRLLNSECQAGGGTAP
ncbi:MAG: hypothetical protein GKR94_24105 [Gammaproteobacteria bacterium]|nr:hypothetical protein [Gammaproteobacteria bacterium]